MKYQYNLMPDRDALGSTRSDAARWVTPAHVETGIRLGRQLHGQAVRQAFARIWRAVGGGVGAIAGRLAIWRARARTRRYLALMDGRLLRDIGLSRLDAKHEINKPFWRE